MAQIHVQYQAPVSGPNGVAPGPRGPQFMLTSLYVEDPDASVTDEQLFQMFSQVAQVASVRVYRDLATGRSIGYGYVNYNNPRGGHWIYLISLHCITSLFTSCILSEILVFIRVALQTYLSSLKRLENILRWLSNLVLLMMRACYLMIYSEKRKLHFVVDPLLNCHCNLFCY